MIVVVTKMVVAPIVPLVQVAGPVTSGGMAVPGGAVPEGGGKECGRMKL